MILYKYFPPGRNFFEERFLRFTPRTALNDPFEIRPSESSLAEQMKRNHPDKLMDDFEGDYETIFNPILGADFFHKHGILSLSKTRNNLLMWSHYSKNHSGYVIGFDANHEFFNRTNKKYKQPGKVYKVTHAYSRNRKIENINDWYFHKSIDWKYEKEYRMILPLNECDKVLKHDVDGNLIEEITEKNEITKLDNLGHYQYKCLFRIPYDAINSVIFGAKSDLGELNVPIRDSIRADGYENLIGIYNMKLDKERYKLQILPGLSYWQQP